MHKVDRFIFAAGFFLLSGGMTQCTYSNASHLKSEPHYEIGQEVVVEGIVSENVLDCVRDLSCYLRLATENGEVTVLYASSRGTPCFNHRAGQKGMEIRKGDKVRVFALAIGNSGLSTCPDEKYVLVSINDSNP